MKDEFGPVGKGPMASAVHKVEVFEPPMCCAGGSCGPVLDSEVARWNDAVRRLGQQGIAVERVLLNQSPHLFMKNREVSSLLQTEGQSALPVTVFSNRIVCKGRYPTFEELMDVVNSVCP